MSESDSLNVRAIRGSLTVNGHPLEIDALLNDPDYLYTVLNLGHTSILEGIQEYYEEMTRKNPDAKVKRAPVKVARLGAYAKRKSILTPDGAKNGTSIHTHPSELKEKYHGVWDVINHAGFSAEVRSNFTGPIVGGVWLMLKAIGDDPAIRQYFEEKYPKWLTCEEVMLDIAEGVTPVRLSDSNAVLHSYDVPSAALTRLTPPDYHPSYQRAPLTQLLVWEYWHVRLLTPHVHRAQCS